MFNAYKIISIKMTHFSNFKSLVNEVINEKELDELFRDYYRHRENSILQLVLLLFSKKEMDRKENEERIENIVNEKSGPEINSSIIT